MPVRPQVLVLSDEGSHTVESLVACVSSLGGEAHVLSTKSLPRQGSVVLDNDPQIAVGYKHVPVDDCLGVWV